MSTDSLAKPNKLLSEMGDFLDLFAKDSFFTALKSVRVDWESREAKNMPKDLVEAFEKRGFIKTEGTRQILSPKGITFLGKLLVDIESIQCSKDIDDKYIIERIIVSGKNSVTFKAFHQYIGRYFALKVIRPGSGENIVEKLSQIGKVGGSPYLVHPVDYLVLKHETLNGTPINLKCLLFPYIEGETLNSFLSKATPISPFFVYSFIKQVSTAIAALESKGLYHGDLHADNIIVTFHEQSKILFQIIDISCGIGDKSPYDYGFNDFQHFQEHLWNTLRILQKHLPRMSIRKHLGAELYSLVDFLLNQTSFPFAKILELLKNKEPYLEYEKRRRQFIEQKFKEPEPMGLLRYEEFTDHQLAMKLFEPYPELLDELSKFGNSIIYGHRGSGKSTYLSALSCFPEINKPIFDLSDKFGIFFACRQGEFRQFSSDIIKITAKSLRLIKHIIILKIIRRFIDILSDLIRVRRLTDSENIESLFDFLNDYISEGASYHYDSDIISPLQNLHTSLLRDEISIIDDLFSGKTQAVISKLFDERSLIQFFELIRGLFHELADTQFYILFDDAGDPNVSKPGQWIINDIMRCTNAIFCVKLSAERYSYDFKDTHNKVLEESHDYSSFDISANLSLGSGISPERIKLKNYFKKIVDKRLAHGGYASHDITEYLGDVLIKTDVLVELLAKSKRNAYYCGWNVIWELSNRTTRNLLELVSQVLIAGEVTNQSPPKIIPKRTQHQTVKAFSEKKLKSLVYIPGKLSVNGKEYGLGIKLYEFAASFGKIAKEYLRYKSVRSSRSNRKRFDERLAIERDDLFPLSESAELFLRYLIRFAVLDDVQLVFARDDKLKKPLYTLNRIFCPAFNISFRRDSHLRVSSAKFEMLLLEPIRYFRSGTKFLATRSVPQQEILDLFGRLNDN